MVKSLSEIQVGRKKYYIDERLRQLRNVRNPLDYVDFGGVIEVKGQVIELPEWVAIVDKTHVVIATTDFAGTHYHAIKRDMVLHTDGVNPLMTGVRILGTVSGDWRQMVHLSEELEAIFSALNEV